MAIVTASMQATPPSKAEPASWATTPAIRASMQSNRSRDTAPEIALRSEVHRLGLRFRVATRPVRPLRRTADLVFPGARVAVFLDGCYWHGCSEHHRQPTLNSDYWSAKVQRNRERDAATGKSLPPRAGTSSECGNTKTREQRQGASQRWCEASLGLVCRQALQCRW